jgi:spore cortex formation protein SpoVR/YcgB (stage V sporulation)
MNRLYDKGLISEGALLEFLHSHTSVVFQPDFDDPRYSGLNPYALGFAMMEDIKRIAENPTAEDKDWFADFAGCGDYMAVLRNAWANYRDESFIEQFLSPHLMRKLRLFALHDKAGAGAYEVTHIHDERGYRDTRAALARLYDVALCDPNIQVARADLQSSRTLHLTFRPHRGVPLHRTSKEQVHAHIRRLWGHDVEFMDEKAD